jgi:hypothetical protein
MIDEKKIIIINKENLLYGCGTKQRFCAIHSKFDTSSLKENCKKNICEQNTKLFLSHTFEPSLAFAEHQCYRLRPPSLTIAPPQPDMGWRLSLPSSVFRHAPLQNLILMHQNRILMPQHRILMLQNSFSDSKLKPRVRK